MVAHEGSVKGHWQTVHGASERVVEEPTPTWQQLAELIRGKTGVAAEPGTPLVMLDIDSVVMAELTLEVEQAFGIRVDDEVLEVETIDDLAAYIDSRVARRRNNAS